MRDFVFRNMRPYGAFMESFDDFGRILIFPNLYVNYLYESRDKNIFEKISDDKLKNSKIVRKITIDRYSNKFWIETGGYRNTTTFKGRVVDRGSSRLVRGSFTNSGAWISYPGLILAIVGWISFKISRVDPSEMFHCLVFFVIFHLVIVNIFYKNIRETLKFLENELEMYPVVGGHIP